METVFEDGNLIIRPTKPDEPGGIIMPVDALAAWSQLLGTSSMAETMDMTTPPGSSGLVGRMMRFPSSKMVSICFLLVR